MTVPVSPIGSKASPIGGGYGLRCPGSRSSVGHYALRREARHEPLNAVADYGIKLAASNGKLFVAGIGWGGAQSFRFAAGRSDLAAALLICGASPDKDSIARIKATIFGFYASSDERVNTIVPPAQASARAAAVVFEAVTYAGVGPGFMQSGEAPDATPADKLACGYARERMKSVLDMVSLRGY
jgi:carboxymethylenebutenolidase